MKSNNLKRREYELDKLVFKSDENQQNWSSVDLNRSFSCYHLLLEKIVFFCDPRNSGSILVQEIDENWIVEKKFIFFSEMIEK